MRIRNRKRVWVDGKPLEAILPCRRCGCPKERGGRRWYCDACRPLAKREAMDRYRIAEANRRKDPEYARRAARVTHIAARKRRYGITEDMYQAMLRWQDSKCAICGTHRADRAGVRRFGIDHDHRTGRVRGLLCFRCNSWLGWYEKFHAEIKKYLSDAARGGVLQLCLATGYTRDSRRDGHEEPGPPDALACK